MSETVSTEVADTISLFGGLNNSFTGAQAVDSGTVESSNQANTAGYDLVPTLRQSGTSSIAKTGSNGFCSKAASILSLPYEILQLIIEDEDVTCEDRFAFKLANRSFLHLKPEWDTLKSMISPEGRYDLACRLNWIPADTYLCSACRKRHDAAFFSLAEQRKTDQERKCIGMFSGVLLFENTLLTMSGIQKLLSEQGVCSHEAHVPVFLLLEQCDKDLQRVKRDRPARVDNPVKLNVRVSNQEHCNYVQYTLKHVTADDSLYLTGRARLYLPWLEFFISIAQHANHSNLALQTAWYHHMRLWTIPLCGHEDLSDSQPLKLPCKRAHTHLRTSPVLQAMALADEICAKPTQLVLVLHAAMSHRAGVDAGFAITQCAYSDSTGKAENRHLLKSERQCKIGFTRSQLKSENVTTAERAHLFALTKALDLARKKIERDNGPSQKSEVRKVVICSESQQVVTQISRCINDPSSVFEKEICRKTRAFVETILAGILKLSQHGLKVDVSFADGKGKAVRKARTTAKKIAREIARRKSSGGCTESCRNPLHASHKKSKQARKEATGPKAQEEAPRPQAKKQATRPQTRQRLVHLIGQRVGNTGHEEATGGPSTLHIRQKDSHGVVRHEVIAGGLGAFELVIREQQPATDVKEGYVVVQSQ